MGSSNDSRKEAKKWHELKDSPMLSYGSNNFYGNLSYNPNSQNQFNRKNPVYNINYNYFQNNPVSIVPQISTIMMHQDNQNYLFGNGWGKVHYPQINAALQNPFHCNINFNGGQMLPQNLSNQMNIPTLFNIKQPFTYTNSCLLEVYYYLE